MQCHGSPIFREILSHCPKVSGAIVASRSLPALAARFSRRRASLESFGGTQEGAMNFEGSDGWVASWLLPWELWIRCMNWFSHITLSYFITHPISDISHVTCESYYLGLASIGIGCNHLIFFCSWSGQCRVTGNFTALPACRETLGLIWISQCYFRGPSQSQHFPGRWHIIMTMMEAIDALARELYGSWQYRARTWC